VGDGAMRASALPAGGELDSELGPVGRDGQGAKEAIQNNMNNWRAVILTAGEARARRIPVSVCNA
jgi:hypothetical protein